MPTYIEHHDWKVHLKSLPELESLPDWQGYGDFACLVIPIFSFDIRTRHIEEYIAKTASWSMWTWKQNSDAQIFNVPCFLYVEEGVADVAIPILKANGVPDDHILVRKYDRTAWLAKCLQPVFDETLNGYEYIVISDLDMFAIKSHDDKLLPIFELIRRKRPTGFGCKIYHECVPLYWMTRLSELYAYKTGKKLSRPLIDVWCDALHVLSGRNDLRKFIDQGVYDDRPWTGIMISHREAFKDKDWFSKVCNVFGDDEAAVYCWMKQSEENIAWDTIEFGLPTYTDLFQYVDKAFSDCGWEWHLKQMNGLEFKDVSTKDACLLHHFASIDYKFNQIIGI